MNQFAEALNEIKKYALQKTSLEALKNVKLELCSDVLTLTATDLESTAVTTLPLLGEDFATATNVEKLHSIVKSMSDPIQLLMESGKLIVSSGSSRAILSTLPVEEFPPKPERGGWLGYLDLTPIKRVWPFADFDYGRPVLEQVLIELDKDEAIFVAADGFKMAKLATQFNPADDFEPIKLLVSAKVLAKLSGRKDLNASISFLSGESNHVTFRMNNFELTVSLSEGRFPDYQQMFSTHFGGEFEVNVKNWKAALKMLAPFAEENFGIIRGHMEGRNLILSTDDKEGNIVEESIPILFNGGEIPPFALGLKHVNTVLDACAAERIKARFQNFSQTREIQEDKQHFTVNPIVFEDVMDNSDQFFDFFECPKVVWRAVCMPMAIRSS